LNGYTKYRSNQVRVDRDQRTGEQFEVTINRHGFRGLEFAVEKEPGVIRVVTLGASSTFGYFNRDETTYPVLLEQVLREGCQGGSRYEVINLGIPHLKVEAIRALFLAEGIPLDPDIVTVYSGLNDSPTLGVVRHSHLNAPRGRIEALRARLLSVAFVDSLLDLRGLRISAAEVERESAQASENFHTHLSAIHEVCESRGILFLALSQQVTSMTIPFDRLAGVTYGEELARVSDMLKSEPQLLHNYVFRFLGHSVIMRDLRSWVEKESVPFVDVQAALDSDRDVLLSWVHLSPRGNQLIANAIGEEILTRTCREQPVDASVRQRGGGG
jgi:lysophospholipase L1-like esterase